jgi:hypothetical protein
VVLARQLGGRRPGLKAAIFLITRSEVSVTIRESHRSNILTVPEVYGLDSAKLGTPSPHPPCDGFVL